MAKTKQLFEEQQTNAPADFMPVEPAPMQDQAIYHTESVWNSPQLDKLLLALQRFHQADISIKKDRTVPVGGGRMRSYTTLDEIISKIKPVLTNCGLIITQHMAGDSVVTFLHHVSGQFLASKVAFTPMNGNNVNALQAYGGGLTYLKRYSISALLFVSSDEDLDGADAGNHTVAALPSLPADKFAEVKKFLANGGTIAQVRQKYTISKEVENQLTQE